jgi:hypothetical protein
VTKWRGLIFLLLVTAAAGCGSSLPATVTGTVTLDGEPLPAGETVTGTVVFYPASQGAAAYGTVGPGGRYAIRTGSTTGLQPGEYLVTVRVVEIAPAPPGGHLHAPPQRLLTPPRYNDRDRSDLRVDVQPGRNMIDLPLVSG